MKIAIASGKGGTGKTTVAVNLACVAENVRDSVTYMDCDVEEPNGAIFLKPEYQEDSPVYVNVPAVDLEKCTGCGLCGQICQFSAIAAMNDRVLTFPELCHSCGGCKLVCPAGAISDEPREIGRLQSGKAGDTGKINFVQGLLKIGQVMSPPLIRRVKAAAPSAELVISDCPPGTSCPVIESLRGNDFVLLVTEPTPFGLNDLRLAVETVREMELPFAVAINRAGSGDNETQKYCQDANIRILAEIPDLREVAVAYSKGLPASRVSSTYAEGFSNLLDAIDRELTQ